VDFKVLNIENTNECRLYAHSFDKIFSFCCFHCVRNKLDALKNIHLMLKSGGEVLFDYSLITPLVESYKYLDAE